MFKSLCIAILAAVLTVSFSTVSFTQDEMKQETIKKDDMDKEMSMGPLKSVSCDPACGFMVRSHSEKEIITMVKAHAKKMHNKVLTDKDVKAMIKTEEPPAPKD